VLPDPAPGKKPNYVPVQMNVWWHSGSPTEIHITTANDPRFDNGSQKQPGLHLAVSSNPHSANYNPSAFNRCIKALEYEKLPAPDPVPEHNRQLRSRNRVISAIEMKVQHGPCSCECPGCDQGTHCMKEAKGCGYRRRPRQDGGARD
jgi:hypothetical protein